MDSGSRSGLILRAGVSKQPGEEREGGEMRAIGSASEGSAIRESVITTSLLPEAVGQPVAADE